MAEIKTIMTDETGEKIVAKLDDIKTAIQNSSSGGTDLTDYYTKDETDTAIDTKINALDVSDSAVSGQYVSAVKEENGKITVSRADLPTSSGGSDQVCDCMGNKGTYDASSKTATIAGITYHLTDTDKDGNSGYFYDIESSNDTNNCTFEELILDYIVVNGEIYYCGQVYDDAFQGCSSLASVTVSGGQVYDDAFQGCSSLASVTVSGGQVYGAAFQGCSSLASVTVSGGQVYDDAFNDCSSLASVTVSGGQVYGAAFQGCSFLASVTVSGGQVYEAAFQGCSFLASVTVSGGQVYEAAFQNCDSLASVTVSGGQVYDTAFQGCGDNFSGLKVFVAVFEEDQINFLWSVQHREATVYSYYYIFDRI